MKQEEPLCPGSERRQRNSGNRDPALQEAAEFLTILTKWRTLMRRMLFVSFDQPEDVSGRLHVYVGKEKICTLSNHESFDGVELTAGRNVVRAVFGPSTWLLPFARRNVRHAEHAMAPGSCTSR